MFCYNSLVFCYTSLLFRYNGLVVRHSSLLIRYSSLLSRYNGLLFRYNGLLIRLVDRYQFSRVRAPHLPRKQHKIWTIQREKTISDKTRFPTKVHLGHEDFIF